MPARIAILALWLTASTAAPAAADPAPQDALELAKRAFVYGREYFVLRSGRAETVVQADRVDLGPACTFLLFDAQDAHQSARKVRAFNFDAAAGFAASALEVELGGYRFTALGHRTDTGWVVADGIPAVQAVWWAGGIRVTEQISALSDTGVFRRSIRLEGAHLLGAEPATLRLSLPPGPCRSEGPVLAQSRPGATLGLAVLEKGDIRRAESKNELAIGPVSVAPGTAVNIDTLLVASIPAGELDDLIARAGALAGSQAAAERQATAKQWAGVSSLATQDAIVQAIFDKARFGLAGMIADDGTMDAGIFEYGAQWVRDSSITALGALHAGHFELAHATLERLLTQMVTKDGVTMIGGGFVSPDLEQFDQMGELLHLLRNYRDWTGDDALVRQHRELLLAMIERPLSPQFRDETGMVHNRREFWERQFKDAYELAYQTYVILGLREAIELAPALGAEDRVAHWRAEADRILAAVLSHPTRALVYDGRLIKRRNVTGEVADDPEGFPGAYPDVPLRTETHHRLMPDASAALPIFLRVVDPRSDVARRTLDDLEGLWNTRWSDGGYDRYHTSSQPDQPGPWFTTTFLLRAQHEAGLWERSRRTLEWLNTVQGGRAGAWFEEIPSSRTQAGTAGIVPWASADLAAFVVRQYLGVDFEGGRAVIRPALYPGSPTVLADLRFRQSRLRLVVNGAGPVVSAVVNGEDMAPDRAGRLVLPPAFAGGTIVIQAGK